LSATGAIIYAYVGGNPVNFTDPSGLCFEDLCIGETIAFCARFPALCATAAEAAGGAAMAGICNLIGYCSVADDTSSSDDGGSCPVPDTTRDRITKGNTDIRNKPGDVNTANDDFDALNLNNVSPKGNGVRVGTLGDGSTVIVRPSRDGRHTIEIQSGGRTRIEVRYGPKI
jgi:hypothetical protein